jgi:hypothetical protein
VERKGIVVPTIEVKVLDQLREEFLLDVAEGDEKKALDTETLDYFEILKNQVNVGDVVDVCISPIDSESNPYLAECKQVTIRGEFSEIAVFVIE